MTRNSTRSEHGVEQSVDRHLSRFNDRAEVILRWPPHGKFLRFAEDNRVADHLMSNYSKAKRAFYNRGETFDSILEPYQRLTITGTEKDEKTLERTRDEVIQFFEDIDREITYVPDYAWVYGGMAQADQLGNIDYYVDRVEWLVDRCEELGLDHITLRPLAKGLNYSHFERAVEAYDRLGIDEIALYAGQTRSLQKIIRRCHLAWDAFRPERLLVIGRQAPQDVAQLPACVDAVAGYWNWTQACNLTKDGYSSEQFIQWYKHVKRALKTDGEHRQSRLTAPDTKEVSTDGGW